MTWREALRLVAKNVRRRVETAKRSAEAFPFAEAEYKGNASAYSALADELEYAASLPPSEGVAYLRKLGDE